jgi:plastocyanin
MSVHRVEIRDTGGILSFDPPQVTLAPGDWVWWSYPDIPAGQALFLQFQGARFGPFHSVRSLGNDSILGKGNTGQTGTYSYRAVLLDRKTETVVVSGYQEAGIVNQAGQVDTSPEARVVVTPVPGAGSSNPRVDVQVIPDTLSLNAGDTATWVISGPGLTADMLVTFDFTLDPDGTASKNRTGPFSSFYTMAGGVQGGEEVEIRAHATGFLTGAGTHTPLESVPARFHYNIRVWSTAGGPIGGHDPVIDNLGPPIPS